MQNWYSGLYKGLILASFICFILYGFTTGDTAYGSLVAGYSSLTLGILMIITLVLMGSLVLVEGKGLLEVFTILLSTIGQFLLLLSVIGFMLYLIIYYKGVIKSGHVANGYYSFTTITTLLILIQSYIIYTNLDSERFNVTNKLPKVATHILYLLGVLTWMSSLVIYIILKYYTTDGFTMINK